MNWSDVQASGSGSKSLPAGAYVFMVTDVQDNPANEYLEVVYDVFEGPCKGHYGDEWGQGNAWAHTTKVSYKETAQGLFKRFLDALEKSNTSFNIAQWEQTSNEKAFIGKVFGGAFGIEHYVYDGKQRERKTFMTYYPADEVRNGAAKVPEDKFTDEWLNFEPSAPATENQGGYDDYVPFM